MKTKLTHTEKIWKAIEIEFTNYEEQSRARESYMDEAYAMKLAASINDAFRKTDDERSRNMDATAHPVPTGETKGIIQIVEENRWYVVVGRIDGCFLIPIYHFTSDVEVASFAKIVMMLIEDPDEMEREIERWNEKWL